MHVSNKCSIAIHCLIFIHEYGTENKVTSELLSLSTGCNPVTIRGILSALKKSGVLYVKSGTGGATLAAEPEDITLYRICTAVEPDAIDKMIGIHSSPSAFCPVGRKKCRIGLWRRRLCRKSITLDRILADYHDKQQKSQ